MEKRPGRSAARLFIGGIGMRILVVGDGKVGHTLAEQLTREGHDVVVIDNNETVLQRCEDALDVMCIQGNGANARTLMDAGVDLSLIHI